MENLNVTMEKDLGQTIEGEFGVPVSITFADGTSQTKSANDNTIDLKAQIRYFTLSENPETGEVITVYKPVISFRRTSLNQIPEPGERFHIRMPISPELGATIEDFVHSETHSPEGPSDMGFIRYYVQRAEQI